jgi:molecular chaperone DnaK
LKIRKTVGIDLGTTNSVIAVLDPTETYLITGRDEAGHQTFPSVVGYQAEAQVGLVGHAARRLWSGPAATVRSVKRFMGLERSFAVGPEGLTPVDVSARILRHLRDVLGRTLADQRYMLDSAIITMPAYFNHNQIEATRRAGELAGLEVVELLHEPTAAAIYYGWRLNHAEATYLVYDLGGGTFDASVIRRRHGDYEVVSVSGDPFLGGDDFDRLLASYLVSSGQVRGDNLDLSPGTPNFDRLVQAAEGIKTALSVHESVRRDIPDLLRDEAGEPASLDVQVDRATFQRLIKDKVDRTIDACREALHRARAKAGIGLAEIDHVLLVGGSSRIPLVRETVRTAFCNPNLPERARAAEPLLDEPDLCVAYGAALRAATYGRKFIFDYRFSMFDGPEGRANPATTRTAQPTELEVHVTSPLNVSNPKYVLTGVVRVGEQSTIALEGMSVRVQCPAIGLVEEVFLDERGTFEQLMELPTDGSFGVEFTVCDPGGRDLVKVPLEVRHQVGVQSLGQGVLPTQIITKPLQIEVLDRRSHRRTRIAVAPVGAGLPGTFRCACRTLDQSGRILVPIYEENRLIKQMMIDQVDLSLPPGTPVEIELQIDVKHQIRVQVAVPSSGRGPTQVVTATIVAPPPPSRPTRADLEAVYQEIREILGELRGGYRTRAAASAERLAGDLREALTYEDEPRAIQRMAELCDLRDQLRVGRTLVLDPPWPRFAQLVKQCLHQGAEVADKTGWVREELFEQVYTQERYAEQAFEEKNQTLYRECFENLRKYAGYLDQLLEEKLPQVGRVRMMSPADEARQEADLFRRFLETVTAQARMRGRGDLQESLAGLARQGYTLSERVRSDPVGAVREARRLATEVAKVEEELLRPERWAAGSGLLEGAV